LPGRRAQQPEHAGEFYLHATHRAGAWQLFAGEDHRFAPEQFGGRIGLRWKRARRDAMDVEVRIRGLMMDPATNMPIVVLKDVASETVMPIWVGIFEANAIAIEIEKVAVSRPMTHDLTRNLIRHLNARLERVVISELKDDTFFAVLWLRQGDQPVVIDARPSDAIALALRSDCPIYVAEEVMQTAKLNTTGPPEGPTAEQLRGWLEGLNDEDLGRYKM
jgi:bifunctional DNase/RNase